MEDLKEWLDNRIKEVFEEMGFKEAIDDEKKEKPITGTITFLKGDSAKKAAAVFGRQRGEIIRNYEKILLHIPHSSTAFPEESPYSFNDLDDEEKKLIDYYTDELFTMPQIERVVFPYCRLYCDVERLINDPLEAKGLGISYHRRRSFSTLNTAFSLYADHHAEMSKKIVAMGEGTLLIDCHSFSSIPNLLNSNPPDIDICIGYNDDETCPDKVVIGNMAHYFKTLGYKVGINEPFTNSKTFAVPVKYHSVMIEVNKRLYMNEQTLEKTEGFKKLKNEIQALYNRLKII